MLYDVSDGLLALGLTLSPADGCSRPVSTCIESELETGSRVACSLALIADACAFPGCRELMVIVVGSGFLE